MFHGRRELLHRAAAAAGLVAAAPLATLTSCAAARSPASPGAAQSLGAVAFDALAVFDPRPVSAHAERLFPGRGAEVTQVWRTRQFEYTWLRTVSGRHVDFWQVTEDALVFTAKLLKLDLGPRERAELLEAHLALGTWPDVPEALSALRSAGLRLALLSNFTAKMLGAAIERSGLTGVFEHVLSTDQARTYKPDPRAYRLGAEAFGLPAEQILFVPFAGWDAAGAAWFGYPTFWVNRLKLPAEELAVSPDAIGESLTDLVDHLASRR